MKPEQALAKARERAARRQADYAGDPALTGDDLAEASAVDGVPPELLREWATIEVGAGDAYSTRRLGVPITFAKRGLLRLMRQYTAQLEARQTRFNLAALARLEELEGRLERLEGDRGGDTAPRAPR